MKLTAEEKFILCRALFDSQLVYPTPAAAHQFRMSVNVISNLICPNFDENTAFRNLCNRDNWINDNPFNDDVQQS